MALSGWLVSLPIVCVLACSNDERDGSEAVGGSGAGAAAGVAAAGSSSDAGSSGATGGGTGGGAQSGAGPAEAGSAPVPACPDDVLIPDGFHVSPTGTEAGDGSEQAPWDLATALAQPSSVTPGTLLWLHGGTYSGSFTSVLLGEPDSPITLRGYPGERAVLDGAPTPNAQVLTINGAFSIFQDFEVTSSFATRVITDNGSNPADARGSGVGMYAEGVKLVNLVIHDTGVGVGNWSPAPDGEVYGCIIFYNGWDAPDRGHGHGIYAQNETGKKYLTDNVIFRQFSYGIHGYTEGGKIDNFEVVGNIVFNNGEASAQSGFATDILVGGLQVAQAPVIRDNATYFPMAEGGNNVGYDAGCSDATITDNYLVAGTALSLENCTGATTLTNNDFIGAISGFEEIAYPMNRYSAARPTGTHVVLRPNKYDVSRAHLAIFNWDELDAVPVDLSGVLAPGDTYEVLDVQDLFGTPLVTGEYSGAAVDIPMTTSAVTAPIGNVPVSMPHTSKEFGAFLIRRACP